MTKVAVLDDWQHLARDSAGLVGAGTARAREFFHTALSGSDDTAGRLAEFDIIQAMRERTRLPADADRASARGSRCSA